MEKPTISKLPTSQMMKLCQVFGLQTDETRSQMVATLQRVTDAQWKSAKVAFVVDQLD